MPGNGRSPLSEQDNLFLAATTAPGVAISLDIASEDLQTYFQFSAGKVVTPFDERKIVNISALMPNRAITMSEAMLREFGLAQTIRNIRALPSAQGLSQLKKLLTQAANNNVMPLWTLQQYDQLRGDLLQTVVKNKAAKKHSEQIQQLLKDQKTRYQQNPDLLVKRVYDDLRLALQVYAVQYDIDALKTRLNLLKNFLLHVPLSQQYQNLFSEIDNAIQIIATVDIDKITKPMARLVQNIASWFDTSVWPASTRLSALYEQVRDNVTMPPVIDATKARQAVIRRQQNKDTAISTSESNSTVAKKKSVRSTPRVKASPGALVTSAAVLAGLAMNASGAAATAIFTDNGVVVSNGVESIAQSPVYTLDPAFAASKNSQPRIAVSQDGKIAATNLENAVNPLFGTVRLYVVDECGEVIVDHHQAHADLEDPDSVRGHDVVLTDNNEVVVLSSFEDASGATRIHFMKKPLGGSAEIHTNFAPSDLLNRAWKLDIADPKPGTDQSATEPAPVVYTRGSTSGASPDTLVLNHVRLNNGTFTGEIVIPNTDSAVYDEPKAAQLPDGGLVVIATKKLSGGQAEVIAFRFDNSTPRQLLLTLPITNNGLPHKSPTIACNASGKCKIAYTETQPGVNHDVMAATLDTASNGLVLVGSPFAATQNTTAKQEAPSIVVHNDGKWELSYEQEITASTRNIQTEHLNALDQHVGTAITNTEAGTVSRQKEPSVAIMPNGDTAMVYRVENTTVDGTQHHIKVQRSKRGSANATPGAFFKSCPSKTTPTPEGTSPPVVRPGLGTDNADSSQSMVLAVAVGASVAVLCLLFVAVCVVVARKKRNSLRENSDSSGSESTSASGSPKKSGTSHSGDSAGDNVLSAGHTLRTRQWGKGEREILLDINMHYASKLGIEALMRQENLYMPQIRMGGVGDRNSKVFELLRKQELSTNNNDDDLELLLEIKDPDQINKLKAQFAISESLIKGGATHVMPFYEMVENSDAKGKTVLQVAMPLPHLGALAWVRNTLQSQVAQDWISKDKQAQLLHHFSLQIVKALHELQQQNVIMPHFTLLDLWLDKSQKLYLIPRECVQQVKINRQQEVQQLHQLALNLAQLYGMEVTNLAALRQLPAITNAPRDSVESIIALCLQAAESNAVSLTIITKELQKIAGELPAATFDSFCKVALQNRAIYSQSGKVLDYGLGHATLEPSLHAAPGESVATPSSPRSSQRSAASALVAGSVFSGGYVNQPGTPLRGSYANQPPIAEMQSPHYPMSYPTPADDVPETPQGYANGPSGHVTPIGYANQPSVR